MGGGSQVFFVCTKMKQVKRKLHLQYAYYCIAFASISN